MLFLYFILIVHKQLKDLNKKNKDLYMKINYIA